MISFVLLSTLCILFSQHSAQANPDRPSKACYGKLGCFSIGTDFVTQLLPQRRKTVATSFWLYDRTQRKKGRQLIAGKIGALRKAKVSAEKPWQFIIHGFMKSKKAQWVKDMRRDLLIRDDVNVVEVDWSNGASFPYTKATANTRLVGAEIAFLIRFLKNKARGFKLANVHLIGHSLGAHIAGYAGEYFKRTKLGRISGLDPAGLYFKGVNSRARIDSNDAEFVDVYHSNDGSIFYGYFGITDAVGFVDFYLNGGERQPGCGGFSNFFKNWATRGLVESIACSHMRVVHYFRATILSKCPSVAFRCKSYDAFKTGKCLNCWPGSCIPVGMNAKKSSLGRKPRRGIYFLDTGADFPYCNYQYGISIQFATSVKKAKGRFYIRLNHLHGNSSNEITLPYEGWCKIKSSTKCNGMQTFQWDQGVFQSVSFRWEKKSNLNWFTRWILYVFRFFYRRPTHVTHVNNIFVYDPLKRERTTEYCLKGKLKTRTTYKFKRCQPTKYKPGWVGDDV